MRLRLGILFLIAATAWPAAADRLPDMRWLFERAERLARRGDADRHACIHAWALVPLLYPDDVPLTENDDVWRMIALASLERLDARDAGFPPPRDPVPLAPPPPPDALRDQLGVIATIADDGTTTVDAVLVPETGLTRGDRVLGCDSAMLAGRNDLAARIAAAAIRGSAVLDLDGGRSVTLAWPNAAGTPRLAGWSWHGSLAAWETERRWLLPAIDGAWLLSGTRGPAVAIEVDAGEPRTAPGADRWTAISASGAAGLLVRRLGVAAGEVEVQAVPLRSAWIRRTLDADHPRHRLMLGVRAGQPLVIESTAAAPHLLLVQDVDGEMWSSLPAGPALSHRLERHGPAGAMCATAIERNGMVQLTVEPAAGPDVEVRLRILVLDPAATANAQRGDLRP